MKLFFLKDDSLYKIFKTLEKAPKNKKIQVYIETNSQFFQHERRGKQIKELIVDKKLTVVFITKSLSLRAYYKNLGLSVLYLKEKPLYKIIKSAYLFLFNIKRFHLLAYSSKKSATFYVLFFFEICVILFILYLLYGLLLPKTTITLYPNYDVESVIYNFRYYPDQDNAFKKYSPQLTIPYRLGTIEVEHAMTIAVKDILYLQTPSKGVVRIVNKTAKPLGLIKNTQLITDDGLLFKTTHFVNVPAANSGDAGFSFVKVVANDVDKRNELMGPRGNVKKDTRMYVRKLKESKYKKEIYIDALYDLDGGQIEKKHAIDSGDIQQLQNKLQDYIQNNKLSLVKNSAKLNKNSLILPLLDTIHLKSQKFSYLLPKSITGTTIYGKLSENISFLYVNKQEIIDTFMTFIEQRTNTADNLISLNKNSLAFLSIKPAAQTGVFIITTKIDIVKGYDFNRDPNGILSSIKKKIAGKSLNNKPNDPSVKEIILSYPEIGNLDIVVSLPWYHSISQLQSRILFEFDTP